MHIQWEIGDLLLRETYTYMTFYWIFRKILLIVRR